MTTSPTDRDGLLGPAQAPHSTKVSKPSKHKRKARVAVPADPPEGAVTVEHEAKAETEPFPVMPMVAVTVIVACDNIAFAQIFPYLGYLIIYLGLVTDEVEVVFFLCHT